MSDGLRIRIPNLLTSKHKWLITTSVILLFLSYAFNIFGVGSSSGNFETFQKDSESLVINRLNCKRVHGKDLFGGQLVVGKDGLQPDSNICDPTLFEAYVSQYGIQGQIISYFAPHDQAKVGGYLWLVKIILVSSLVALLVALIVAIAQEFSMVPASVVLVCLVISEWMVYYARNLYWVPVLLFMPFVFSFIFYPKFKARSKVNYFYLSLGAIIFLKSLAGYEFITSIILSAFAPVLYYEIKASQRIQWRKLLKMLIKVGSVGVAGFVLALVFHVTEATLYFHSFNKATAAIEKRAAVRTVDNPSETLESVVTNFQHQEPEIADVINRFYPLDTLDSFRPFFYWKVLAISALHYTFLGLVSVPFIFREPIGVILQSMFLAVVIALIMIYRWHMRGLLKSSAQHLALAAMVLFGLASSVSWLVLAQGHALNHPHLNGIVFYLPFAIVYYIMLGVLAERLFKKKI